MLTVETRAEASEIRSQIEDGAAFGRLARERSIDALAGDAGYMGSVRIRNLRREFRDALAGLAPGDTSPVVEVGGRQVLLQILTEAEESWIDQDERARAAFVDGRLSDAASAFTLALETAESFGPTDYRLAQTLNNLGAVSYQSGDFETAGIFFERALAIMEAVFGDANPDVANGLENLAEVHLLNRNPADAEAALGRALAIREASDGPRSPSVALTLSRLAEALGNQERYGEAAGALRRSLSILEETAGPDDPSTASVRASLGTVLSFDEATYDEAEQVLRRARGQLEAAYGPDSPAALDALQGLGDLAHRRGDYAGAVSVSEELLRVRWGGSGPASDPAALLDQFTELIGLDTFRDGEFDAALESFLADAADSTVSGDLYLFMKDVFDEAGMSSEAVRLMEAIAPLFPGSRVIEHELAESLAGAQRFEDALVRFQAASRVQPLVAMSPEDNAAELSRIHRRAGDMAVAISELEVAADEYDRAIALDGGNLPAHLERAKLDSLLSEPDAALARYDAVLERDPENVEAHSGRADVLLRSGDVSGALETADRALAVDPGDTRALFVRGTALMRGGETETGRSELARYTQLQESAVRAEESRSQLVAIRREAADAFLSGAPEPGIAALREGLARYPQTPALHLSLGIALGKLGRQEEAIEAFENAVALGLSDDFVLHFHLAAAYSESGNAGEALRHRSLYLRRLIAQIAARFDSPASD